MKVLIDKTLKKDTDKVKDPKVKNRLSKIIRNIQEIDNFTEIKNIKKLKGSQSYYRIRMGDYRIGLEKIDEETILVVRFLHRKEIYKKWP